MNTQKDITYSMAEARWLWQIIWSSTEDSPKG
nr:MAG TPA: hypothetical protein [Caudoviricetes sp.]